MEVKIIDEFSKRIIYILLLLILITHKKYNDFSLIEGEKLSLDHHIFFIFFIILFLNKTLNKKEYNLPWNIIPPILVYLKAQVFH